MVIRVDFAPSSLKEVIHKTLATQVFPTLVNKESEARKEYHDQGHTMSRRQSLLANPIARFQKRLYCPSCLPEPNKSISSPLILNCAAKWLQVSKSLQPSGPSASCHQILFAEPHQLCLQIPVRARPEERR